jgi:hypothetical protein
MAGNRHDFVVTEIGQLEKTRNPFMAQVVPAQIWELDLFDGISEGMDDPATRLHRQYPSGLRPSLQLLDEPLRLTRTRNLLFARI